MLLTVMYEEGFSGRRVMEAADLFQAELPIQKPLSYNLLLWTCSTHFAEVYAFNILQAVCLVFFITSLTTVHENEPFSMQYPSLCIM